jgi:L-lactate dehydrogenase
MKIAIIGAGAVGSACLTSLVMRGSANEIIVIDLSPERTRGLVTDIQYGATLFPSVTVRAGNYSDLQDAALVIITAGVNEKAGGATNRSDPAGRLRLLATNVEIFKDILSRLQPVAPEALVLVVTDPPDPLADAVRMLGHTQVLSTGTYLDSLRFRFHLARRFGVSPNSVSAQVLGEHGTSEVFVWSSAQIASIPVQHFLSQHSGEKFETFRRDVENEVKFANISIIEGIGASQHGIGMVTSRIAEIILRDERAVIPVGAYNPKYGVTLSLPTILGREGALQSFEPTLSEEEQHGLQHGIETLKEATSRIKIS